jgi:uncharacterized protein YjiS (DUF1127 family)
MPRLAAYIKHVDWIALIHHKNTGDLMTQISHAARLSHRSVRTNGTLISRFVQAYAGWQQRKRLTTLDDAALRDIGLTRTQADAEAARPMWNAPAQWLR